MNNLPNPNDSAGNALRVAVIGAGAMGQAHCRTIAEQVPEMRLAAVVDAHAETAGAVARTHDVPGFASVGELIAARIADTALVATPHPLHRTVVEDCLSAGMHVLCEKPLAENVSAADAMLEAAHRTGRALGVMFQRRFDPVFEAALDFAREGRLGAVRRTLLVLPDFRCQAYFDANPWRATWKGEGGGVLINQAPHLLDLFLLLGGMPSALRGHTATCLHGIEVEDRADARLLYANGAVGQVYASTNEPKHHEMFEIVGSRGSLTYRRESLEFLVFEDELDRLSADSERIWARPGIRDATPAVQSVPGNQLQGRLMRNFARHVLLGEPLRCDAASGRMSLEIANAITLSSYTERPVTLPLPRNAYDALIEELRARGHSKKPTRAVSRETDPGLV